MNGPLTQDSKDHIADLLAEADRVCKVRHPNDSIEVRMLAQFWRCWNAFMTGVTTSDVLHPRADADTDAALPLFMGADLHRPDRDALGKVVMTFRDEEVNRMWVAIQAAKRQQLLKALQVAQEAAWGDLPRNEQERYLRLGLEAVKAEEAVN